MVSCFIKDQQQVNILSRSKNSKKRSYVVENDRAVQIDCQRRELSHIAIEDDCDHITLCNILPEHVEVIRCQSQLQIWDTSVGSGVLLVIIDCHAGDEVTAGAGYIAVDDGSGSICHAIDITDLSVFKFGLDFDPYSVAEETGLAELAGIGISAMLCELEHECCWTIH